MSERTLKAARVASVIAATAISLACGTNYAYSAWAPEFADRMELSSTQINLIGTFANLGMYLAGIPAGLLVDNRGARPGSVLGSACLGVGYFGIYGAYRGGPGSMGMVWMCIFAALTGAGGCAAFLGAIKTCALNFPNHRGTATAFPLSAFGLSAFFFSLISSLAFPDNTAELLLLLSVVTLVLPLVGGAFLRVVPRSHDYHQLSRTDDESPSLRLTRSKSEESTGSHNKPFTGEIGTRTEGFQEAPEDEEDPSLLSSPGPEDDPEHLKKSEQSDAPHPDIRGLAMLKHVKFYQLFSLLGLLTGIGLMTINNIGNDARAIWHHYDDSATPEFIAKRQLTQVEFLSIMSFIGRLLSGIGSDILVRRYHLSRFWCITISASIFLVAQLSGTTIQTPQYLSLLSGLTGLAYGFLFGFYPALVAETFGVQGLSQNWGAMTLANIVGGNVFNILYGRVFDAHSVIRKDGKRECSDGVDCYRAAYAVTLVAAGVGVCISLWNVRWDWAGRRRKRGKGQGREA